MTKKSTYYDILGVPPQATPEEIQRAFELCRETYAPDSMGIYSLGSPKETAANLAEITEAYQVLKDPQQRLQYDRKKLRAAPPVAQAPLHGKRPPKSSLVPFLATIDVYSGEVLRKARILAGYGLEDLARETCVRMTYLRALEEENYHVLPTGEIYVRGFLRLYATSLGLPLPRALDEYMLRYHEKRALGEKMDHAG